MTFELSKFVKEAEVIRSSELSRRCVAAGIDPVHARKLIARAANKNGVWRSDYLALQRNERLFARRSFVASPEFHNHLLPILEAERPGLYRLARRLRQTGVVLRPHAEMLLASPLNHQGAKFPTYDLEVAAVEELLLGRVQNKDTIRERIVSQSVDDGMAHSALGVEALAELQADVCLTSIVMDHLRRQNIVSWNSVVTPQGTEFISLNNYRFCGATFSWLAPIVRAKAGKKGTPTPVVFHVSCTICNKWDVEGFLARIQRLVKNGKSGFRVLGVIAAADFSTDAWRLAKSEGLMVINLRQLFGDATMRAVQSMQGLLKNVVGDSNAAVPSHYEDLSKMLDNLKENPFVTEIKSLAFETLTGLYINAAHWHDVRLNLKVPFPLPGNRFTEREIDVCGQKNDWLHIIAIECKALKSGKPLQPEDVRKFFTESAPSLIKAKCRDKKPISCNAEIWTTGEITAGARDALLQIKLPSYFAPKLVGRDELRQSIPVLLKPTVRLLETIASL